MPLTPAQADLVAEHHEVATRAAIVAARRWPRTDKGDLLSYAFLGLIDAAQTYDPERGVTFVGWARSIVRHRIVDEWRREHGRRSDVTVAPFDPADPELSFDIVRAASSVDLGYDRVVEAGDAAATVEGLGLSERERTVLVELGKGLTLQEVAVGLGVSESRVAQIRSAVRRRLPERQRRCAHCLTVLPGDAPPWMAFCSLLCQRRRYHGRVLQGPARKWTRRTA